MCALITFHLPFREMTVTPLDFVAITGLSFFGELVSFSSNACSFVVVRNRWLRDSFGIMAPVMSYFSSLIRYTHLVEKVRAENDTGHVSSEQLGRCFLFYLLRIVIFLNPLGIVFLQL